MEIQCIRNFKEFLDIKEEWNDVHQRSGSDNIYLRHEWLSSWWQSYSDNKELLVLALRQNNKLIGVAPLMISKEIIRGIAVNKIAFMGDATWTLGDFFITVNQKEEVVEKIVEYLLELKWDIINLQNIPDESSNLHALIKIGVIKGFNYLVKKGATSPLVKVSESWESFHQSRSLRFRKATRNKLNKINKAGQINIQRYTSPEEIKHVLPIIYEIGLKGWKHRQLKNAISSSEGNKSFYRGLSEKMSELGCLNIWLLTLNEQPVAFEYHINYKNVDYGLIADFDEGYKELSPGSILDYHIMQYIFQNSDVKEYDMGCGESFYKKNWTDDVKPSVKLFIYRNTLRGKILMLIETRIIPWLRPLRDKFNKSVDGPKEILINK